MKKLLVFALLFTVFAGAQAPVPALPRVYIDTTWNAPVGGTTWQAHTSATFTAALNAALPGDIIVLDAGYTYTGNFTLPKKVNTSNKWIYIESSALSRLPSPGTQVSPSNAPNMPKIATANVSPAFTLAPGANHYRLVGLEITSNSTQGGFPNYVPPINNFTYCLICWSPAIGLALPDSITVDRDYLHGSPSQDVGQGVQANGSNFAVIDSYISDIHESTFDSQAILVYWTPGPIKIVDNYLSATTEDVMFGGAGDYNNPYVPSDIEIRKNHFFKPLTWDVCGVHGTVPPGELLPNGVACPASPKNQWVEKNNLELKSARRAIITGNTMENTWVSAQTGSSVLFTVRPSQSGNLAVVDDITFQSNFLKNVDSGIVTLAADDLCTPQYYPHCTSAGESRRVWVDNNLIVLIPSLDTYQHTWLKVLPGLTDHVFQHNTTLMSNGSVMWFYVFELAAQYGCSPPSSATHNVWLLDNVMARQPTGDCGFQGTSGLTIYMGDPAPLATRFYGNVMYVPAGDRLQTFPAHNYATMVPFNYVSSAQNDYQLTSPLWTDTSDGKLAGINWTTLQLAMATTAPVGIKPPGGGGTLITANPPIVATAAVKTTVAVKSAVH